jgi:hypothetical protein
MKPLSPRQAAAKNRGKLTFWWKDTQVNFKNDTYDPITFQPIEDSVGRWNAFTLQPGQEKSIVDSMWSYKGSGARDILWEAKIGDKLIGNFSATNPGMGTPTMVARGMRDLFYFKAVNREYYGYDYGYFNTPGMDGDKTGKKAKWGRISPNNLVKKPAGASVERFGYEYFTDNPGWNAFLPGEPVAIVSYLGDGNGNKTWSFAIAKEGTPQAVI